MSSEVCDQKVPLYNSHMWGKVGSFEVFSLKVGIFINKTSKICSTNESQNPHTGHIKENVCLAEWRVIESFE